MLVCLPGGCVTIAERFPGCVGDPLLLCLLESARWRDDLGVWPASVPVSGHLRRSLWDGSPSRILFLASFSRFATGACLTKRCRGGLPSHDVRRLFHPVNQLSIVGCTERDGWRLWCSVLCPRDSFLLKPRLGVSVAGAELVVPDKRLQCPRRCHIAVAATGCVARASFELPLPRGFVSNLRM